MTDLDLSYYNDLLSTTKERSIKIHFDSKVLNKYYVDPQIGHHSESDSTLVLDGKEVLFKADKKTIYTDIDELEGKTHSSKKKETALVSFLLHDKVKEILPEDSNEITIGTICRAMCLIGNHYVSYRQSEIEGKLYEEMISDSFEEIKLFQFLLDYRAGKEGIRKINISLESKFKTKPINLPEGWFLFFMEEFENKFNNSKYTIDKYYQDHIDGALYFIKSFGKPKDRRNKIISDYALILESLIKHYNLGTKNSRHLMIGLLLNYMGFVSKKSSTQNYADHIKQILRRRK
jgi:hypothetical protein